MVYSLILLRISSDHESYRLAGLIGIGCTVLETVLLVLGSTGGVIVFISLIKNVVALIFVVVIDVLKVVYLYRTAQAFKTQFWDRKSGCSKMRPDFLYKTTKK